MPIYSNVPVFVRRGTYYKNGGVVLRRLQPKAANHMEIRLYASTAFAMKIGNADFQGDKIYDDYGLIVTDYAGPTLSIQERGKCHGRYNSVGMILYTVGVHDDLENRSDAVLVRKSDARYVEVLSGGGYNRSDRRMYDNIVLRVSCTYKRFIVIQRDKSRRKLRAGDTLFVASSEGVERIELCSETINDVMAEYGLSPFMGNWQRI